MTLPLIRCRICGNHKADALGFLKSDAPLALWAKAEELSEIARVAFLVSFSVRAIAKTRKKSGEARDRPRTQRRADA
jgi:hypothetical protein